MALTAKQILSKKNNVTSFTIDGDEYFCRSFNALDVKKINEIDDYMGRIISFIILGLCDKNGKPLFTEDNFEELMEVDNGLLMEISENVIKNSGVFKQRETAKN